MDLTTSYLASSCDDRGWTWPGDPSRLRSLALGLALYLDPALGHRHCRWALGLPMAGNREAFIPITKNDCRHRCCSRFGYLPTMSGWPPRWMSRAADTEHAIMHYPAERAGLPLSLSSSIECA
jgi:hypothetical protein